MSPSFRRLTLITVDIDILKPDTGIMTIERPSHSNSATESPEMHTPDPEHDHGSIRREVYAEPVSEGEDDDDEENALVPALDEGKRTGLTGVEFEEAIAARRLQEELREEERKRKSAATVGDEHGQGNARDPDEFAVEDSDERTPFLPERGRRRASQPIIASTDKATRGFSIDPLAPSQTFDATFKKLKAEEPLSKQIRRRLGGAADEGATHEPRSRSGRGRSPRRSQSRDGLDEASTMDTAERSAERRNGASGGDERMLEQNWRAEPGKRIAVPVRIEPKVYFASERTFLVRLRPIIRIICSILMPFISFQKWLQFGVLIGTISTTLLNFMPPDDLSGLIAAALFTLAALLAIAYSGVIFVYRSIKLRRRHADGLYYDKWGPTVLCLVLGAALMTNVVLRVIDI